MKRRVLLAGSFVCLTAACAVYDVRDFGATGDGASKETAAIQKAIDAAHEAGGGMVRIGAGTFLSGSLFLKSNVDLFLDRGATLKGSPDREDYNRVDVCVQNGASKAESASGAHLLLCIEQTNVTVRGSGRIDGNSGAFLAGPDGKNWPGGQSAIPWRTSQMLYFVESDSVRVEGVSLIDAPYWSCFFHGCTHVVARNLLVRTRREPVHTHNGDGIDIDSCEDVEVSNCDIDTADDCITLRADTMRLKNKRPCARVRVSDCRLSSPCNAVRIGVGDGVIHDAVLKSLEIHDTRTAVDIVSSWRKGGKGVDFRDILFDGMKVDCRMFCRIYHRYAKTATFTGIKFANVTGTTRLPAWVTGRKSDPVEEVTFENVNLPNGLSAFNVTRLNIIGGALARNEIPPETLTCYNKRIDEADEFPGGVKIGGVVRGATAFGGDVKMPMRGICAHQGDCQFFPGNTAEALLSAARKGAAMVEFDVQRCKTGEFVLMHDGTIENLTTGTGRIREHSLEALKSFTIRRFKEKGYRIPTFDEALDVLPDGGILINVHCYAGRAAIGDIARHLKARGRLHQAFVCSGLKDIAEARKAVPEIVANNIGRPGPRNRDWTPDECAKFVADSKKNKCQYLQLCRPWERNYSDDAHAAGVKVIHFKSDEPEQLKDLFERGIDFVMTNRLEPMNEAFAKLGMDQYKANAMDEDPVACIAHLMPRPVRVETAATGKSSVVSAATRGKITVVRGPVPGAPAATADEACTAFVVGKKASATGYVIVGHNNDGFGPMRYAILPATDSAPALDEPGRVKGLGGGPSTALYWQAVYSDKARVGRATGDVLLNEHGVMMFSNSGGFMREWGGKTSVMPEEPTGDVVDGGIGLALRFEVVRKAKSAAEGVKIATALIDRYGYGPDARTFTIADRNEAWVLCAVRGRRYVARRCPDDAVMAYPNILPIGRILPGDIVSPGIEAQRDMFDFAGAYQGVRTKHAPSQKHRIAEFYRISAGVEVDEGDLPWSVKPAHPISADDLKRGFSSHAVGPGRVSVHPEEEPGVSWPICRLRTLESVICRFAENPAETLISLAPGRPCETRYDEFRPFRDAPPAYFVTGAAAEKLLAGRFCVEIDGTACRVGKNGPAANSHESRPMTNDHEPPSTVNDQP